MIIVIIIMSVWLAHTVKSLATCACSLMRDRAYGAGIPRFNPRTDKLNSGFHPFEVGK